MQASQSIQRQAQGLRLQEKPFVIEMSGSFMQASSKVNLPKLVNLLKRIFLRLGFDAYKGENHEDGLRLRISGNHMNTGRYCDNHSLKIGKVRIKDDFQVGFYDLGDTYNLSLSLCKENGKAEAA